MAAGTFQLYDATAKALMGGGDLTTVTVKLALVASTYTPNQDTDDAWADVSANEIANGNGYTTGGYTLLTPVLTEITKGFKFSSANPSWTAEGGNIPAWRYMVMYISGTVEGVTNPVLAYCLGDSTPADVPATSDGNPLTITCPANGWFDMTRP
jgi:hypothetical protein